MLVVSTVPGAPPQREGHRQAVRHPDDDVANTSVEVKWCSVVLHVAPG